MNTARWVCHSGSSPIWTKRHALHKDGERTRCGVSVPPGAQTSDGTVECAHCRKVILGEMIFPPRPQDARP